VSQNDPFSRLPEVPAFELTSTDVADGQRLPDAQASGAMGVPGGQDRSPQLSWSGFPDGTQSFVVQMYDPDAPTMSGFWHWIVADVPASVTSLEAGAALPEGAVAFANDAGQPGYVGAAPPAGHGPHRYFLVVSALDVPSLGLPAEASPAYVGFTVAGHVLARAVLVGTFEQ
jgi:Raf kinase inhibitor-like YbhB/YbcL family protein